jgi:hypothetical protein
MVADARLEAFSVTAARVIRFCQFRSEFQLFRRPNLTSNISLSSFLFVGIGLKSRFDNCFVLKYFSAFLQSAQGSARIFLKLGVITDGLVK